MDFQRVDFQRVKDRLWFFVRPQGEFMKL